MSAVDESAGEHARDRARCYPEPGRPVEAQRGDEVPLRQGAWFGIGGEQPRAGGIFAGVVFNRPIDQVLTYHVPDRFRQIIQPGQRVRVPLGKGGLLAVGYCVQLESHPPAALDGARIKDVIDVLDAFPLIDRHMLELTRWLADYYACSWGQALDAA